MRKTQRNIWGFAWNYALLIYLEQNNLEAVDETKREIIDLYEEDFTKIDSGGLAGDIYDAIPASLSGNASRYVLANAPIVGMPLTKDTGRYKLFTSDVGL